ncbi:CBS domain containing protein [Musa troglodytarum]|uniref:CBS domain containing protein n=1 Tax=Musa troglodytarum TaxID=320322 RepID=A0A9E7IA11_9LILI|nr:CBS domain containing protein [Musa troglodytarum]
MAAKILPVVKRQHLLLCTLLICNAAAMEALPIFLDSLVTAWGAILISVTLILLFGEIIPQSVCSRYGLAIGAAVAPVVRVLVWICFPVAYPISKFLDYLLGDGHVALFRRAELKTLVSLHGNEVKNLLSIHPDDEVPVRNVTVRKIPRVLEDMPLYDILNEFQKGHSHMAVVVKQANPTDQPNSHRDDLRLDIDGDKLNEKSSKGINPISRAKSYPSNSNSSRSGSRSRKWLRDSTADVLQIDDKPLPSVSEEQEAIGIITMEDVIEELLQEEIFDETDYPEER